MVVVDREKSERGLSKQEKWKSVEGDGNRSTIDVYLVEISDVILYSSIQKIPLIAIDQGDYTYYIINNL